MSLGQSMNISLNSMKNNQYALTVVSHNIANLNTEGYHRQRVNFSEERYTTNCKNVIDTIKGMNGAKIDSLTGFIDEGAFKDLIGKNSDAEYYNSLKNILGDLGDITDELGADGLGALLNDFYTAASNLEKYPTNVAMRQQFLLAADNVCEKFNYTANKLNDFETTKYDDIQMTLSTVNSLLGNLAEANHAHITNNQSDATRSTIDNILSELSNYVDVTTTTNSNGSVNLLVNGVEVVQSTNVNYTFESEYDGEADKPLSIYLKATDGSDKITNDVNESFKAGSLRAYNEILNGSGAKITSLADVKSFVNKAAAAFGKALNDVQLYKNSEDDPTIFAASIVGNEEGNMTLEQATKPLINTNDGSEDFNASNIRVNQEVIDNPFLVAAARIDTSQYEGDEWKKAIGNSDNAAAFSAIRNAKLVEYNGVNLTLSDYLIANAAKTGMDAANAGDKADLYQDIADSAAANYSNLIGVNLDEELADMIKYQRSFEASAKVFATVNNIMDIILNMV